MDWKVDFILFIFIMEEGFFPCAGGRGFQFSFSCAEGEGSWFSSSRSKWSPCCINPSLFFASSRLQGRDAGTLLFSFFPGFSVRHL